MQIRQILKLRAGLYLCLSYILLPAIALATDSVLVNYTKIEDGSMISGSPDNNYGASTNILVKPATRRALLWPMNLYDAVGANKVITDALCSLFVTGVTALGWVYVYGMLKTNLVEGTQLAADPNAPSGGGGNTWNDVDADPTEWGTAGCNTTGTVYNAGDGTGADRRASPMDSINISVWTDSVWYSFNIDTMDANSWYRGDSSGVIFISAGTGDVNIASTENATVAYRPRMWVYYENASTPHVPTSYYINAYGGSNSNNGSIGSPWDSLHYALTNGIVEPGDTVWMRGATYDEQINLKVEGTVNNGTYDSLIYIRGYPGETVILDGGIAMDDTATAHRGRNYCFRDFRVTNSSSHGFEITGEDSTAVYEFRNMQIDSCFGCGIMCGWQNSRHDSVLVDSCTIFHNNGINPDGESVSGVTFDCYGNLYVQNSTISFNGDTTFSSSENKGINMRNRTLIYGWVKNCVFEDNLEAGVQWNAQDGIIEYNTFKGNGIRDPEVGDYGDMNLNMGNAATRNIVRYNQFIDDGRYGYECFGDSNVIYNNSCISRKLWTGGDPTTVVDRSLFHISETDSHNVIINNIFANFIDYDVTLDNDSYAAIMFEIETGYDAYLQNDFDYNCYYTESFPSNKVFIRKGSSVASYTLSEIIAAYGNNDANSIQQYPAFEDTSGTDPDLTLRSTSMCVDAGQDTICVNYGTLSTIILEGFSGDAPDIGYSEFTGDSGGSIIIIIGE